MRFVPGIDYGPRDGTLGVALHMAEGGDGTVGYLRQRPTETRAQWIRRVRGVSANFVVLTTGEVVQMVGWDRASGSMNPSDRSDDEGFYQRRYIVEVLGERYVDPNAWSLSVEICGYREQGPTPAARDAVIELVADCRARYPTIRGVYGHADQTNTKGCPGTAPTMRDVWAAVGHGQEDRVDIYPSKIAAAKLRVDQAMRSGPSAGAPVVGKVRDPEHVYPVHGQDALGADATYLLVDASSSTLPMLWVNVRGVTTPYPHGELPASVDATVVVGATTYAGELTPR